MIEDIKQAVKVLSEGGLILYPTDTIWGIGCDATNPAAVEKVYKLKQRQDSKAMIILLDSDNRLQQYVREVPEMAWQLIEVSDKPLTIIYPGAKNLASNLSAENGSIAIRIVKDEFCQQMISLFKRPVVSTSANISGQKSPSRFDDISEDVQEGVDYIVKWRQEDRNVSHPSAIIQIDVNGQFRIIRN
jgi:L-threonylcarbamoyladenylate synthase